MTKDDDIKASARDLAAILTRMQRGVAFTGAGISTECGIPDFRSPGGLWSRNRPIDFASFLSSQSMRDEAWRRRFALQDAFAQARPGRGHRALARLLAEGSLSGIITQNVDGLHQRASSDDDHGRDHRVIELHGNTTYATCLECGRRHEIDWVRERFDASGGRAPGCAACDGPVKTATVSFGQPMPAQAMATAGDWVRSCDVLLALGSSLVVWPAAGLPAEAKRHGATLVIINREPTELDAVADLVIHADIGDVLEAALNLRFAA